MLKERIEQDLKSAMLAGDSQTVSVLRSVKTAIQYAEVDAKARTEGLDDQVITQILGKEAKKRQESADLYRQGGDEERASTELAEKKIIEKYLPDQLSEEAVKAVVNKVVDGAGTVGPQDMGRIIGEVRNKTAGAADGALIAKLVKERLAA